MDEPFGALDRVLTMIHGGGEWSATSMSKIALAPLLLIWFGFGISSEEVPW